jgi:prolipoprotein diacylglyceryltransferase
MKNKKILIVSSIIFGGIIALWLIICGIIALCTEFTFVNAVQLTVLAVGCSIILYLPLILLIGMSVFGIVWFIKRYKTKHPSNSSDNNDEK